MTSFRQAVKILSGNDNYTFSARYNTCLPERDARASEGVRGHVLHGEIMYCTFQFNIGHVLYMGLVFYVYGLSFSQYTGPSDYVA